MKKKNEKLKSNGIRQQALRYLDEYDLEVVVSEMLNSLVHERDKHPYVYMIKYLAGLMTEEERLEFNLSIPEPYPVARPAVRYPKFDTSSTSLLKNYLTKDQWNQIRHLKTKHGNNINAMTKLSNNNPSDQIGCVLVDGDCVNVYSSVINDIIASIHNISSDFSTLKEFQVNTFSLLKPNDLPLESNNILKKVDKIVLSFSRNMSEYPFNHFSSGTNKLSSVEAQLVKTINTLQLEKIIPQCRQYSLADNKEEVKSLLKYTNFDIKWLNTSGLKQSCPDCRTVFATEDQSLVILINFADHLQLCLCNERDGIDVPQMYNTAIEILNQISLVITYESSQSLGFLTSHINLLGSGFNMSSLITLNKLCKTKFDYNITLNDLAGGLHFDSYSFTNKKKSQLYSSQSCKLFNTNEKQFIVNYILKLCGLIQLDTNEELTSDISFSKLALKEDTCDDQILKTLYEDNYDKMKYLLSVQGRNINSLMKYTSLYPLNKLGMIIQDMSDYNVFFPLINQYIQLTQDFNPLTTDHINKPDIPKEMVEIANEDNIKINNVTICLIRNIEGKQLPHSKYNTNSLVEETIKHVIDTINLKGHYGNYCSLSDGSINEMAAKLIKDNNLPLYHNDNMAKCAMDKDYPSNRGVIQFSKDNLFAIVNDMDHIKFILHIKEVKGEFGNSLVSLLKTVNEFSKHIIFNYDIKLGFLTTNPKYLGTGLDIRLQLKLSKLTKEELREFLNTKNDQQFEYSLADYGDESNCYQVEVRNKVSIGVTETELLTNLLVFINDILLKDK